MKQKKLAAMLLAAGMLMSALPVVAEEVQTAEATEVQAAETQTAEVQDAQAEAQEAAPVNETLAALKGIEGVTVINATDSLVKQLSVRKAFETEWITEDAALAEFVPEEGAVYDLKLETEDEDVLVYPGLSFEEVKTISLYETEGLVYTVSVDMEDKETSTEAYPVEVQEEAVVYYTTSNLNIREMPSTEGEKLGMYSLASEVSVYGKTEGWYLVGYENVYAYVSADYVTEDKAVADAKLEEVKAAEAAAAAAQQAAPSYSQPQYQAPQQSAPAQTPSVYEVSRENVPSCDDPNHGTTYITYSDGSVSVVNY